MNGLGMRSSLSRSVSCTVTRPWFGVCRNARACVSAAPRCSAAHEDRPVSLRFEAPEVASPVKNAATFELPSWVKSCFTFLGAVALGLVLMLASPTTAEAARSGGRIGGSSFNSRSAGSSFSGSYSGSYSAPSRSAPSPGYSGGYGMRSPSVVVAPAPSFGFGLGFGYPAFGYGVPVASTGGSSLFTLLVLGIFAYVLFQTVTSFASQEEEEEYYEDAEPMSVVKLQVGLLGSARQIQRDLNRMANNIDTSTPQGLHYLLQETVLALRRNPQYACYGKATLVKTRGLDNAEAKFNQVSMEERGKFERETLTNFGGQRSSSVARVTGDGLNELIVVTIIAAIDGKVEPVDITSVDDLKTDLNLLGSVPASRLLALEVLWTPQDDNDYFTKEQLIEDYPMLNTI